MTTAPGCAMLNRKLFITRVANPYRNLFERWWTGEEWLWIDHGRPGGVDVTGEPGAAMMDQKLFVTVDDGSVWERHWRADLDRWAWEPHGRPANRRVRHGPAAPMMNEMRTPIVKIMPMGVSLSQRALSHSFCSSMVSN